MGITLRGVTKDGRHNGDSERVQIWVNRETEDHETGTPLRIRFKNENTITFDVSNPSISFLWMYRFDCNYSANPGKGILTSKVQGYINAIARFTGTSYGGVNIHGDSEKCERRTDVSITTTLTEAVNQGVNLVLKVIKYR